MDAKFYDSKNPYIMKKIFLTLILAMSFTLGYSQLYNSGGAITVESGATLVVQGDYTASASGTILVNGTVELKGNFINNAGTGAVDGASAGTVKFNGTIAQAIDGSSPTTIPCPVEVDNASGLSLTSQPLTLNGSLALTNGKITLGAYDLLVPTGAITGATSANYIVTDGAGALKKTVAGTDVLFPVGNASFNPITLNNNAGTPDTYGVRFADAMPGNWVANDHAVTGNWEVTELVGGGSDLTATTQWNGAQEQTSFDNTDCAVALTTDDGTTATYGASSAATGTDPYAQSGTGFTSVGKFFVGDYFNSGIDLSLNLFLAGAYNAGTMSTALDNAGLIPLSDPYGLSTTVTTIPANTVDWVEVQLRDAGTPSTVIKSYPFFLRNDGVLLNTDGTVGAKLKGVTKASYYVSVKHRNHLGVMTASPVNLSTVGAHSFDFTAGTGIYGTNAMKNISGVFALWSGDTDGNGSVQYATGTSDITPVSNTVINDPNNTTFDPTFVGNPVYSNADADLNGYVEYATGTSDISPISSSVIQSPANVTFDPTFVLLSQLP
jgi:hypothetical protein